MKVKYIFLFEILRVSSLFDVGDRSCVAVSITMVVEAGVYVLARDGAVRTHAQLVLQDAVPLGCGSSRPLLSDSPSRARVSLPDGTFRVASPREFHLYLLPFLALHPGSSRPKSGGCRGQSVPLVRPNPRNCPSLFPFRGVLSPQFRRPTALRQRCLV